MDVKKVIFYHVLILLIFLTPLEFQGVEGNTCSARSENFSGWCWIDAECSLVCLTEFYLTGSCHFQLIPFGRHCICERPC
ncbi:Scorpion toxin-like protein [Dioscorea alata]|uniref:Scorpion toxin-like protein n=1 Tax=Dioscorea alata TaxID=55571 RepID=A0ACB7UNB9_DIOAL|nr:Scorpion toxin-like protein [Dioscorea alata]